MTHDALVAGLLRYGPALVGSRLPDDLVNQVDTQIVNIASRRITGVLLNTRTEALHFAAGTQSVQNLYLQHCALFLHNALASHDSGIRCRLQAELCGISRVTELEPTAERLEVHPETVCLLGKMENMHWMANRHKARTYMEGVRRVGGTFFPHATELGRATRGRN